MTLTNQLKNSTAVQAVVGAGDYVAEQIRKNAANFDIDEAQAAAQKRIDALVAELRDLPEHLRKLPDKAQAAGAETLSVALTQALTVYGELAERGEHLVSRIRNQKSTKDTVDQARTTVAQAKGTATTAKKSAKKAAPRAKTAATTSAKATTTRAKATRTSAKKTAGSATKAATDAAKKVGD